MYGKQYSHLLFSYSLWVMEKLFSCLLCREWIKNCIDLWDAVPNSQFWNSQWAAIIARVIKNYNFIDWEPFLPALFARCLNMFEVRVRNFEAN